MVLGIILTNAVVSQRRCSLTTEETDKGVASFICYTHVRAFERLCIRNAVANGNTTWYYYDGDGTREAIEYNGNVYYYFYNAQGDVMGLFDNELNVVVNYTYDSWGNVVSITGSMSETLGKDNPFRYRGYYYDAETGLYYVNSRYYDSETGRFINADGYVFTGTGLLGFNMFAYCENNPIMYFDPNGKSITGAIFIVTLFASSLVSAVLVEPAMDLVGASANLAGEIYLKNKGYDLTAWMYDYAFKGNGKKLENASLTPMLENKLKNSKELHSALESYINKNKPFDTQDQTIEFKETDLFYSMQHASYRAWGWKENGQWKINIIVWDTFDFGEYRIIKYGIDFANAANDMGTILENINQIKPYEWWIRYEYYY